MCALGLFGAVDAAPHLAEFVVAFVALGIATVVALIPIRNGTRLLILVEAATVALIVATAVVILAKLLGGQAPAGQTLTLDVFTLPPGIDPSTLALGAIFGFFAFVGFEGAATLGEETRNPTRDIPRAILGVVIFAAIFYLVLTSVEVMGFGTNAEQMSAFKASGSLLGDLGRLYIAPLVGTLISAGAAISAFGCCVAILVGASRLLFAVSRDNPGSRGLAFTAGISRRYGTPSGALAVVAAVAALITAAWALAFGASAFDVAVGTATIATLIVLVVYLMLTIGALKFLFLSGRARVPAWEIVIPVAAIAVLGYVLFRNVWPIPASDHPAFWYAAAAAVCLLIAVVIVYAVPGLSRRVGERLAADEGLAAARS
jgi:amino acid transporter